MNNLPLVKTFDAPFYYEINPELDTYYISTINADMQAANGYGNLVSIDKKNELVAVFAYQGVFWFYCRGVYRFDEVGLRAEQYDGFFKCRFVLKRQGVSVLEFKYKPLDPESDVLFDIAYTLNITPRGKLLSNLTEKVNIFSEADLQKSWELKNKATGSENLLLTEIVIVVSILVLFGLVLSNIFWLF